MATKYFGDAIGVFAGGGTRAVAYAGAVSTAILEGVHFRGVAGTSAGALIAALVAAGITGEKLVTVATKDVLRAMIQPPKLSGGWQRFRHTAGGCAPWYGDELQTYVAGGRYSAEPLEKWLNACLAELLGLGEIRVTFRHLSTCPLVVVAADLYSSSPVVWSPLLTPDESVAMAVRASCTIPIVFQLLRHSTRHYADGGLLANLPISYVQKAMSDRGDLPILAFSVVSKSTVPPDRDLRFREIIGRVVDTAISGQMEMQATMGPPCQPIVIDTGTVDGTNFELKQAELDELIKQGMESAETFFDKEEEEVQKSGFLRRTYESPTRGAPLAQTIRLMSSASHSIKVFAGDASWLRDLAPSLLSASLIGGFAPRVLYDRDPLNPKGVQMLRALGCQVARADRTMPVKGSLIDQEDTAGSAVLVERDLDNKFRVRLLCGAPDSGLIDALGILFDDTWKRCAPQSDEGTALATPTLARVETQSVVKAITEMYQELWRKTPGQGHWPGRVDMATVAIAKMRPLAKYMELYKQMRIAQLAELYRRCELQLFECARLSGSSLVFIPPIVEHIGDHYIVIDGMHRVQHARAANTGELQVLAVEPGRIPLPAKPLDDWVAVVLRSGGEQLKMTEMYDGYEAAWYRNARLYMDNLGDALLSEERKTLGHSQS